MSLDNYQKSLHQMATT